MTDKQRPTLLAFLICERVVLDEDGVAIVWRIIDTVNIRMFVSGAQDVEVPCTIFTRWGPPAGTFLEELEVMDPEGQTLGKSKFEFTIKSEFSFRQIRHNVSLGINREGIYHFRLYIDGALVGVHPFRVYITR